MTRLLDNDPEREARRQRRLLDAADARFSNQIAQTIRMAMLQMVAEFERTGSVPAIPYDHERRLTEQYQDMTETVITAFGERILGQGKALGFRIERKEGFAEFFQRLALDWIGQEIIRRRITSIAETRRIMAQWRAPRQRALI